MYKYDLLGITRCGRKHPENQDCILKRIIEWPEPMGPIYLLGVADGISKTPYGGSVARWLMEGDLAKEAVFKAETAPLGEQLRDYLMALSLKFSKEHEGNEAMLSSGAAVAIAGLQGAYADCFWAGDAPLFVSRSDADMAGEQLSRPDVDQHRALKNFFGNSRVFNPHHKKVRMGEGDILTMASDGANIDEYVLQEFYLKQGCSDVTLNMIADMALKSPRADDVSIVALVRRA